MLNDPLAELAGIPGLAGDYARERLENPPLAFEMPEQTEERNIQTAIAQQRAATTASRMKAGDYAQRGIPTYSNDFGEVEAVRDEYGNALTNYNKRSNLGVDSMGNQVQLRWGETGAPKIEDAFAGIPVQVNKTSGEKYQERAGLPRKVVGIDEGIAKVKTARESQNLAAQQDKAVKQAAILAGRKLTLDERKLKLDETEYNVRAKQVAEKYGLKGDEDFDTIEKKVGESFNNEKTGYGSKAANTTNGWFSGDYTPEALALRAKIDQEKAAALNEIRQLRQVGKSMTDRQTQIQTQKQARDAEELAKINAQLGEAQQQGIKIPGQPETPNVIQTEQPAPIGATDVVKPATQQPVEPVERLDPATIPSKEEASKASSSLDKVASAPLDFFDKIKDVKNNWEQLIPFVGGGKELYDIGKIALAANRLREIDKEGGEPGQEDLQMVKAYVDHANKDTTTGYKIASVLSAFTCVCRRACANRGNVYGSGKSSR